MSVSDVPVQRHVTSGGTRLYVLSVRAFAHMQANAVLAVQGPPAAPTYTALIDLGSPEAPSVQDLRAGLERVRQEWGEHWTWTGLSRLIVTHPHPDHAGGLSAVRPLTPAPLAAHAWAAPLLHDPEAARDEARSRLLTYAGWVGGTGSSAERLERRAHKPWLPWAAGEVALPGAGTVQLPLHGGERLDNVFEVIHLPGHEGAQVGLRVDDVLLSADHLLPGNLPPLMPGWVRPGGGLAQYLGALDTLEQVQGVNLAIGGHGEPMPDWRGRVRDIRARYARKLQALLEVAGPQGQTVQELTLRLHPRLREVQAILLLDQTAALVEHLTHQGHLQELPGPPARFVRPA